MSALARVTLSVTAVSVASFYKEGLKVSNCSEMGKFHPEEIKTIRRMRNLAPKSYIQKQSNTVISYTVTYNCSHAPSPSGQAENKNVSLLSLEKLGVGTLKRVVYQNRKKLDGA